MNRLIEEPNENDENIVNEEDIEFDNVEEHENSSVFENHLNFEKRGVLGFLKTLIFKVFKENTIFVRVCTAVKRLAIQNSSFLVKNICNSLSANGMSLNDKASLSNYALYGLPPSLDDFALDKGEALPFISFNKMNNQFEFCSETAEKLCEYPGYISCISIIGRKKSGKSFLMNKLLGTKETHVFK